MEVEEGISRENRSDLIAMKYSCKFCHKRFPCGRSLGGHMRSHLITYPTNHENSYQGKVNTTTPQNSSSNNKQKATNEFLIEAGYELREKRKKTWKATEDDQDPNLLPFQASYINTQQSKNYCCKECGKSFHSSKALCGHMKSHSVEREKEKERLLVKENCFLVEVGDKDSIESSQPDINHRQRRSSRRQRNIGLSNNSNNGSSSSVSEIDQQEQEEVAMCLILLSRDVGPWGGDLSDHSSVFLERVRFRGTEEEQESDYCKSVKSDEEYTTSGKFMCKSYNHIKSKGCSSGIPTPLFNHHSQSVSGPGSVVQAIQKHECSICFRVFASGQALGGHKRSHGIAQLRSEYKLFSADKRATATVTSVQELRDFLDLNQPAPMEEEARNGSNQLH